jgi:hypothetical protein
MHIDVAAAQSGVSRFGERFYADDSSSRWRYSKDEARPLDTTPYTHLLSETPQLYAADFVVVDSVLGFSSLDMSCVMTLARRAATLRATHDDFRCATSSFADGETHRSTWMPFVRLRPSLFLLERR